jgi:DNA-binding LacI/PurR family transcriptional regulator
MLSNRFDQSSADVLCRSSNMAYITSLNGVQSDLEVDIGDRPTLPFLLSNRFEIEESGTLEKARTEPRSRPASIHDVARLAGVSNQTISRVLNEHPSVRGSTRDRVLAAMDALRYRPNRAARMLGTRRSHIIGVLTADAGSRSGQASSVRVIEEAARERGWYSSVVHLSSASPSAISAAAEDLLSQEVEGVVIVAPQVTVVSRIAPLLARIPIVTSLGELRNAGAVTAPSADAGARMAVRYLIEQGHRRIVHVAGPPDWHDAQGRLGAYEAQLRSSGLPVLPPVFGDWSADSGYAAGRSLVVDRARAGGSRRGFTAVFAASDQLALGLLHALREARLEVPGDVSVAGFGDIPEAAHFWPPLTTVRQDVRELGRSQVGVLVDAIGRARGANGGSATDAAAPVVAGPRLVIRKSVAPATP